jgi:hypothetical protein
VIAKYRSEKMSGNWSQDMKIVPVNFNSEHKAMLGHCKMILESDGGRIAINLDRFDKLITALRTAVDNDGTLDKEATSYNDIFVSILFQTVLLMLNCTEIYLIQKQTGIIRSTATFATYLRMILHFICP